jgi:hypothetical protein
VKILFIAATTTDLTLRTDAEVRAISQNAWFSLGRHGVGLHFERRPNRSSELLVLRCAARGKVWEVSLDRVPKARFSRLEEAVEAADYELQRMGRGAASSARPDAAWRQRSAQAAGSGGESGSRAIAAGMLRAPVTRAEALQQAVWARVHGRPLPRG